MSQFLLLQNDDVEHAPVLPRLRNIQLLKQVLGGLDKQVTSRKGMPQGTSNAQMSYVPVNTYKPLLYVVPAESAGVSPHAESICQCRTPAHLLLRVHWERQLLVS